MKALSTRELELKSKAVDERVSKSLRSVYSELLDLGNYFLKLKAELKGDYKKVLQRCERVSYDAAVRYCNYAKNPDTLKALVSGLGKVVPGRLPEKTLNAAVTEVAKGNQTVDEVVAKAKAVKGRSVKAADVKAAVVTETVKARCEEDVTEDYARNIGLEAQRVSYQYKDVKELREDFEDDDDLLREFNYSLKETAFYEAKSSFQDKYFVIADEDNDRKYIDSKYFAFLVKELGISDEKLEKLDRKYHRQIVEEITKSILN